MEPESFKISFGGIASSVLSTNVSYFRGLEISKYVVNHSSLCTHLFRSCNRHFTLFCLLMTGLSVTSKDKLFVLKSIFSESVIEFFFSICLLYTPKLEWALVFIPLLTGECSEHVTRDSWTFESWMLSIAFCSFCEVHRSGLAKLRCKKREAISYFYESRIFSTLSLRLKCVGTL